jgi:hypothetical protein
MNCEAGEPDCTCDETGCYLIDGASCVQGSDCKSQTCGVTEANESVCCVQPCEDDEVCTDNGDGCELAPVCIDEDDRCSASGDYQACDAGQWETVALCEGRGCSATLGGCLKPVGDACGSDDECGVGSCQETPDGSTVCCDLSCGECQVCSTAGTTCVYPNTTKPDCDCDDDSDCADAYPCTTDSCELGVCSTPINSGNCLIDGACYDNNEPEQNNPCRYCDATSKPQGWTNSSVSVSCNDGLYCNGDDTCNGVGACQHEFPTNNRCEGVSGVCALGSGTCDESRNSCNEAAGVQCLSQPEQQCRTGCGGAVQSRTVTAACTGNSADCSGTPTNPAWTDTTVCDVDEVCSNSGGFSCQQATSTCDVWCQPGKLCWTLDEPGTRDLAGAHAYCDGLTRGGKSDWRLPTLPEHLDLSVGCDHTTGTAQSASFQSNCVYDPANPILTPCAPNCPDGAGPTNNGCYWPAEMGDCAEGTQGAYWTATHADGVGDYFYSVYAAHAVTLSAGLTFSVRCVRP